MRLDNSGGGVAFGQSAQVRDGKHRSQRQSHRCLGKVPLQVSRRMRVRITKRNLYRDSHHDKQ